MALQIFHSYARANPYFSGVSKFANKGSFTAFRYIALESEGYVTAASRWEHILALKIRYSEDKYEGDIQSPEYHKILLGAKEGV
jgi:hypothetical protein